MERYFDDVYQNLHLKKEAQEKLFQFFPRTDSWPDGFAAYLSEYSAKKSIPASFLSANTFTAGMSADSLQKVYFGSLVHARYNESKQFINSQINPYWKEADELDSGDEIWALLQAIRQVLWHKYCKDKAREYVNSELRKKVAAPTPEIAPTDDNVTGSATKRGAPKKTPASPVSIAEKAVRIEHKYRELLA